MNPSSGRTRHASTVSAVASRNHSGASRNPELRVSVRARVENIRAVATNVAPKGFLKRVADLMEWRKQRPTREHSGVEKYSVELLLAEIALHRAEGRTEDADRLLGLVNAGQTIRLSAEGAAIIRMRDGQMEFSFA
jgi:hypothetical protein